jgi:uncharacterized NAD-dependent epimerase/dehydratase family protein
MAREQEYFQAIRVRVMTTQDDRIDGNALVYCEGAFNTTYGKTANGLVRFTERYQISGVIDSSCAGGDAGEILDGIQNGMPVYGDIKGAVSTLNEQGTPVSYLVVGLAPDGGRLSETARKDILDALELGLNVDCGLHDFLSDDPEMVSAAQRNKSIIRDVRKTSSRKDLHFFTGDIEEVKCLKLAVLGTDSAVGKRTTGWLIVHGLRKAGYKAEMIGTGQTSWMQGAKYSLMMDSVINDFVSGEIEHAIVSAWKNERPDVIIIEGQGSLMNPAYPGGFEILAAGRPDFVILQHAPRRSDYDGFPGYPIHPLPQQIQVIELVSGRKVLAVAINHELMSEEEILPECVKITQETGLPAFDTLAHGSEALLDVIIPHIHE